MNVLFDTSVLVSALLKSHMHHVAAARWLVAAKSSAVDMFVSAHTLAELYSVLTRMPGKLSAQTAWRLIETGVIKYAAIRTLTGPRYARLVKRLAYSNIVGGLVFDAVIAEVARFARVDAIVTLNVSHFRHLASGTGIDVISPLDSEPPKA
jgi:predicted nucleic acid-binding protein